jgi:hypothetical protein
MNRIRLAWRRLTARRPLVTGPFRLYVHRTPTGAALDVEHYLTAVIHTLADNPDLMELLDEITVDRAESREHDGWEPEDCLVEKLTVALGYTLPLYGDAVGVLADRLHALAPERAVRIPAPREGGAAA